MKKHKKLFRWLIIQAILLTMIATIIASFTNAAFIDVESSDNNSLTAWNSAQWIHTSQSDFSTCVPDGIELTSSPGDVKLAFTSSNAITSSPSTSTGAWNTPLNAYADGGDYAWVLSGDPSDNHTYGGYGFELGTSNITQVRVRTDAWTLGTANLTKNQNPAATAGGALPWTSGNNAYTSDNQNSTVSPVYGSISGGIPSATINGTLPWTSGNNGFTDDNLYATVSPTYGGVTNGNPAITINGILPWTNGNNGYVSDNQSAVVSPTYGGTTSQNPTTTTNGDYPWTNPLQGRTSDNTSATAVSTIPTFRSAGNVAAGFTSGITPTLPAGLQANDVCILVGTTIAGGTLSITTQGSITWNAVSGTPIDVTGGEKLYVWWGRYSSGSTRPTLTATSDHSIARITAYSNVYAGGDPIDVYNTGTETTSDTSYSFATGLTTTYNNQLVITVCSTGRDFTATNNFGTWANISLASITERMDNTTGNGGGGGFGMADGTLITPGTVETWSATLGNASAKAYIAFALKSTVPDNAFDQVYGTFGVTDPVPGSTITKVEIGYEAFATATQRLELYTSNNSGSSWSAVHTSDNLPTADPNNYTYIEVTSDFPWTWDSLGNLAVKAVTKWANGTPTWSLDALVVRVTYDDRRPYDQLFGTFGLSDPISGSTIAKVEIGYEAFATATGKLDIVTSSDNGSSWNSAHTTADLGTSDPNTYTYIDVTGDQTWTWTTLNDTNFKVKAVTNWVSDTPAWSLDALVVRVTYDDRRPYDQIYGTFGLSDPISGSTITKVEIGYEAFASATGKLDISTSSDNGSSWNSAHTTADLATSDPGTYTYIDVTGDQIWAWSSLANGKFQVKIGTNWVSGTPAWSLDALVVRVTYDDRRPYDQIYGSFGITGTSETITKVEVGYEAFASVTGRLDISTSSNGGSSWNTVHTTADLTTSDPNAYTYIDVTGDQTWTWSLLADPNLKVKAVTNWAGGTPSWSLDALIVRVTYKGLDDELIRTRVSWDGGATWSSYSSNQTTGSEVSYWNDFTSATNWTSEKLFNSNFLVSVEGVTAGDTGDVRLDWIPVEVTYQEYASPGTIASQVLDTGAAGSSWDGIFWDQSLRPGTGISFEVRASDTPFSENDTGPSWFSAGNISGQNFILPYSPSTYDGSAWTNPQYAYADDADYATILSATPSDYTIWGSYGIELPDETITQVRVKTDAWCTGLQTTSVDNPSVTSDGTLPWTNGTDGLTSNDQYAVVSPAYGATISNLSTNTTDGVVPWTNASNGYTSNNQSATAVYSDTTSSKASPTGDGEAAGTIQLAQGRLPTGDGDVTGTWSGTYASIDEGNALGIAGSSADYEGCTANGYKLSTFAAFNVPDGATIVSVQVYHYAIRSGTTVQSARLKVGGSYYDTSVTLSTGYVWRATTWATNPATGSAWTAADVNGTSGTNLQQFGYNVTNRGTYVRLAACYIVVNYTYADNAFENIDETTVDNTDSITIYSTGSSQYQLFTFNPSSFSLPENAQNIRLRLTYVACEQGQVANTNNIRAAIRVNGSNFLTTDTGNNPPILATQYQYTFSTNPNTGAAWLYEDIVGTGDNPLQQIGVSSSDSNPTVKVSMIFAEVLYYNPHDQVYGSFGITDPGSSAITKVEIGYEAFATATQQLELYTSNNSGSSWSAVHTSDNLPTADPNDYTYIEVTPDFPWTWDSLGNLAVKVVTKWANGTPTWSLDALVVRVTYDDKRPYDQIYGTFGITGTSETISKVEVGYEAFATATGKLDIVTSSNGGSSWNTVHTTDNLNLSDTDNYTYIDVTGDQTWTWADLDDDSFKVKAVTNWVSGTPAWSLDALVVRVTYTSAADDKIRVAVSWDGGTSWGSNYDTILTGSEATYWTNVTGDTSWTSAKLNDSNFLVKVSAVSVGDASIVNLDWLSVEVTYSVYDVMYSINIENAVGQYKQWRATLTPNGMRTETPALQEVRNYYYSNE